MESNRRGKGDKAESPDKVIHFQWKVASAIDGMLERMDSDLIKSVGVEAELSWYPCTSIIWYSRKQKISAKNSEWGWIVGLRRDIMIGECRGMDEGEVTPS